VMYAIVVGENRSFAAQHHISKSEKHPSR